jgi:L-ascorbate metabolism protein UlaG (beta-lactamase superfamily)
LDITWYGLSCFRLVERNQTTVVADPYNSSLGLPEPKLKGDVVTVSHDSSGHNAVDLVKDQQYVLAGAGEYEIGGIFITGIAMHFADEAKGRYHRNVAYLIKYPNDINVLHLGDLAHVPDQSTIEAFGEVTVLLVPIGGGTTLNADQAAEVISLIEPNYIVPMHYAIDGLDLNLEPIDKFLRVMGVSNAEYQDFLRVSASDLPEQSEVIVLTPNISD